MFIATQFTTPQETTLNVHQPQVNKENGVCVCVCVCVCVGFPCGSDGKESACNAGDLCSIPGFGRSFGGEGW